jgi:hypothetical protein
LLLEFGDPYVAIICARDFFSADPSEFDEGVVEGVGVGDGALCVGVTTSRWSTGIANHLSFASDVMCSCSKTFGTMLTNSRGAESSRKLTNMLRLLSIAPAAHFVLQ